jgi:hypothetical protein
MCNGSKLDLGIYELKHELFLLAFEEPGLEKLRSFVVQDYAQNLTDMYNVHCTLHVQVFVLHYIQRK